MVTVACLLPGRAKDLSAPPHMSQDNDILYTQKHMFHISVVTMQRKLQQLHLHVIKTAQYSKVKVKFSHNKS